MSLYLTAEQKQLGKANYEAASKELSRRGFMKGVLAGAAVLPVAAAVYFGSMKWTPWIKVIETTTVPKTHNANGLLLVEGDEKEPLGKRILETPVNAEASEVLRDPHSSFYAYVPVGSIKKGEALVTKGAGKTTQCAACHGADLKGFGPVPGIAGRSPSYLVRQMYDMQQGTRNGTWTQLMKPVVANLSEEDLIDIAAYTASRMP